MKLTLKFPKYLLLIINSITISTYFLPHQVSFLHIHIPKYINSPILAIEILISILHSFASFVASL
uniref:Putative ovule protein n=1 Tax=Solanum chacoense TaxID=4108 RepID=A0A0V0GFW5_SOLCH